MTCDWCLLCKDATLDAEQRVTLHGIFYAVDGASPRSALGSCYLSARLRGVPTATVTVAVTVFGPDGQPWAEHPPFDLEVEVSGAALVAVPFEGLPVPRPGPYRFALRVQEVELASTTLMVWPPPDATTRPVAG